MGLARVPQIRCNQCSLFYCQHLNAFQFYKYLGSTCLCQTLHKVGSKVDTVPALAMFLFSQELS